MCSSTNFIGEELISSVASFSFPNSYHSINEEVTPCVEPLDGPKPPPPPTESLIKTNSLRSNEDLLPPLHPMAEANLGSYNTQPVDSVHMQESYALNSELDSLRRENEELKAEIVKLKSRVKRLNDENLRLVNENTGLRNSCHYKAEMPIPEQGAGATKQSEMVPKGSGTY